MSRLMLTFKSDSVVSIVYEFELEKSSQVSSMRSCEAVATKRETAPKESTMIQVGSKRIAYMQMKHLF